jgi:eukaryotic-like serine/threonine-protein kinase
MAEVYRAHDRVLQRPVAVKLLRSIAGSDSDRARFTDEALMLARLNHPGLVTILDAATTDDHPYLVMELIRGPSLAECCAGVALEPARVAAIGAQLADALGYAHSCGVVHRDLKPGNVLLDNEDRALVTDFGIARLMSESARHTATGVTVGTAAYLAPEQVRGDDVTPAADVYSLGLVLLEALTGERAYRGSPTEVALARLSTRPAIPDTVSGPWRELLGAMTALTPGDRPTTHDAATSLRALASAELSSNPAAETGTQAASTRPLTTPVPERAGSDGTAETMRLRARRRPPQLPLVKHWQWVAAVAGLVLIAAVIVAVSLGGGDQSSSEPPAEVPPRLEQPLRDLHDAVNGQG